MRPALHCGVQQCCYMLTVAEYKHITLYFPMREAGGVRDVAQAARRWFLTVEPWVQSRMF
jgi:hypothetical protein